MKIVFMGTPDFAVPCLDILIKSEKTDVVAVYTRPDRKSGRGLKLKPTPVKELALQSGIKVFQPEKLSEPENLEILKKLNPDVICVVAYSQFLRKNILELPKYGCLNVHASILPRYRGAAPIQWALVKGERETGVSVMKMVKKMDAGAVYATRRTPITDEDNSQSVHERLSFMGAKLLMETLENIESGHAVAHEQNESEVTFAPPLTKQDGKLDWNEDARNLFNKLQGFTPWPGAYTHFNGKAVNIVKARLVNSVVGCCLQETSHFWMNDPKSLFVQCGKGILEILEIRPQGKKTMCGADFFRGLKDQKEFRFE